MDFSEIERGAYLFRKTEAVGCLNLYRIIGMAILLLRDNPPFYANSDGGLVPCRAFGLSHFVPIFFVGFSIDPSAYSLFGVGSGLAHYRKVQIITQPYG